MPPNILAAVQDAYNQDTIRLRLVENDVAAMHNAMEAGRL
jgi:hypothetical protein